MYSVHSSVVPLGFSMMPVDILVHHDARFARLRRWDSESYSGEVVGNVGVVGLIQLLALELEAAILGESLSGVDGSGVTPWRVYQL